MLSFGVTEKPSLIKLAFLFVGPADVLKLGFPLWPFMQPALTSSPLALASSYLSGYRLMGGLHHAFLMKVYMRLQDSGVMLSMRLRLSQSQSLRWHQTPFGD